MPRQRIGQASMVYLLPHLLERAAENDPDHVALRFRGHSLTYGELLRKASALAGSLIDDGVEPGDRVGILASKGFESAVALYGIMLAGGVYVPMDPASPAARVEFLIRDCGIRRLVGDQGQRAILDQLDASGVPIASVFGVEDAGWSFRSVPWTEILEFPTDPPRSRITEQDLCYILYTSGSTGSPKGIMHTHRSALAWAEVSASTYGLSPSDVISNYAPLHFDLSTLDYFGGARAGATTVIIPEEYPRFPASLAELISAERMTVFYTVPLALVGLAAPGIIDGKDLGDLRLVLFGGEPMPVKHLRALMRKIPHAQFVNVYGPTETNGCVHYVLPGIPGDDVEALPIGHPYPNVDVLVVDDDGAPVGEGEQGELLVRTPTVMRGYWGRPDLNERAFVYRNEHGGQPDVFEATGDIVARAPDGNLRFLGRRDRQIKARGNRVELDEVEAVLLGNPEVHEAAVYAAHDAAESLQIHAEVILVDGSTADSTELLAFLRGALPAYSIPATLRIRGSFPRTSTGKIDRTAMQAEASAPSSATVFAGPRVV